LKSKAKYVHVEGSLLELLSGSSKTPHFVLPEGLLPSAQETATCPYLNHTNHSLSEPHKPFPI